MYIYKSNQLLLLNWYKYEKIPLKKFILDYINDTDDTIKNIFRILLPSDENYKITTRISPEERYIYILNNNYDTSTTYYIKINKDIVIDIFEYFNIKIEISEINIEYLSSNDKNIYDFINICKKNKLNYNIYNNYLNKLFLLFKKYLPEYIYYSPYSLCYSIGFNNYNEHMDNNFDPSGYCITVSYLYLYYFIYFIEKKEYYNVSQLDIKFSILMSQLIHNINHNNELDIKRNFASILFQYYYKFIYDLLNKYKNIEFKISTNDKIKTYIKNNIPELIDSTEYILKFEITDENIKIELNINSNLIQFLFDGKDFTIGMGINNLTRINEDKLYNFIQWLSFNFFYESKPKFLNLFYYETIIKGTTFLENMTECDKQNLNNKYFKNI